MMMSSTIELSPNGRFLAPRQDRSFDLRVAQKLLARETSCWRSAQLLSEKAASSQCFQACAMRGRLGGDPGCEGLQSGVGAAAARRQCIIGARTGHAGDIANKMQAFAILEVRQH